MSRQQKLDLAQRRAGPLENDRWYWHLRTRNVEILWKRRSECTHPMGILDAICSASCGDLLPEGLANRKRRPPPHALMGVTHLVSLRDAGQIGIPARRLKGKPRHSRELL